METQFVARQSVLNESLPPFELSILDFDLPSL